MNLVTVKDLQYKIGKKIILTDLNLEIAPEEIVTIIGPNGAGKTTLLRCILGLLKASSGEVTLKPGIRLAYTPQKITIDKIIPMTVKRFLQLSEPKIAKILQEAQATSISHLLDQSMQELSGGEMQRVLLAKALLAKPDLLVLDEPAQGIDVNGQIEFYNLISKLRDERHLSILMVSHDLHLVMAGTGRVYCINKHVCCSGTPEHISKNPEFLQLFEKAVSGLAVYAHDHNHSHDPGGAINE